MYVHVCIYMFILHKYVSIKLNIQEDSIDSFSPDSSDNPPCF